MGRSRTSALSNAAKALAVPVLAAAGFWLGGLPGLLLGFVAADLVRYAVTASALHRLGFPVLRYDVPLTVLILLVGLPALWVSHWASPRPWPQLAVGVVAVVLPWAGLLAGWFRGRFRPAAATA